MAIINFVRDYERIARFRLGRFEGMMGPGIVFAIPILDQTVKVDTRTQVIEILLQSGITKDDVRVDVDFLIHLRVDLNNAAKAVLEVVDYRAAVVSLAGSTMEAVLGEMAVKGVLSQREAVAEMVRHRLDEESQRWGVIVTDAVIRNIETQRKE